MRAELDMPMSLYIHVPFCASKCSYCDFVSRAWWGPAEHRRFVDAALDSVEAAVRAGQLREVATVYVGGGTPTVLADELVRLVGGVLDCVRHASDVEVTIEANPESAERALVASLVRAGVGRFSLGVQSFDDRVLGSLGRCHDAATARSAAAVLHESGARFSVDLICGVPGQSEASWMSTVLEAIATGAGHVSVYPLTVEEGTPLEAMVEEGGAAEPDPDQAARDMRIAAELLEAAGLQRYETANYARAGEESRHNLGYWTGRAYIGIGPSAASMVPTPDGGRVRWTASYDIDAWLADPHGVEPSERETLSHEAALREDAMLGLRLRDGITGQLAASAGVVAVLEDLASAGLVEHLEPDDTQHQTLEPDRWRVTERGWLLGNEVFAAVWNA